MELKAYLKEIESFLKEYLQNAHCDKYVLGISGGVDSSLCAALAKNAVGKDKLLCLIIPIESLQADVDDALLLAKDLDLNYLIFDANKIYESYVKTYKDLNQDLNRDTLSNLKARIRMTILYAFAQKNNGLVIGTDNADERYVGYFTKYGDGACDVLPIAHLLKGEVVEASKILGVRNSLAERVASAGLFDGQTDEGEMGIKYRDLDAFLRGEEIDEESLKRIEHLHKISAHKLKEIPTPIKFERNK